MMLKEKIYTHYLHILNNNIAMLQQTLADLKESGSNETKSTAGDKHETPLAMLQIEQANTRAQLKEATAQQVILKNLNISIASTKIIPGSVVKTDKGYFFLSIALGKIVIDDFTVYALSVQSPLGAKLMGLSVGDRVGVNGNNYLVQVIL